MEQVKESGELVSQNFTVKTGVFLGGKGVGSAPQLVDFPGQLIRITAAGAFEGHMLQEVGQPIFRSSFIPGAGIDPDPQGDGVKMGYGFGYHPDAVRQDRFSDTR